MSFIRKIIEELPSEADFTCTLKKEAYHYFCSLDVRTDGQAYRISESSNDPDTAQLTVLQELKKRNEAKASHQFPSGFQKQE